MSVPHHGFRDDPPPAPVPTAGYYAECTGLPDCPVHSVGAGVCPQLVALVVDGPDRVDELAGIAAHAADVARTAKTMGRAELAQHAAELDGVIGDMVGLQVEENAPSLWTYLDAFAAHADRRFRLHGSPPRLWCGSDHECPGWALTVAERSSVVGLVEFLREHWTCGGGDG